MLCACSCPLNSIWTDQSTTFIYIDASTHCSFSRPSICLQMSRWYVSLTFWQEMCQEALGPLEPSVRLLLDVLGSFNSLYHLWNTSHICQNRSVEFKEMSGEHASWPRAGAFFSPMRHFECVCVCVACVCMSQASHADSATAYLFQQGRGI